MLLLQSQGIPSRILYPYCWWHVIHLAAGFYCQFPLTASQPHSLALSCSRPLAPHR